LPEVREQGLGQQRVQLCVIKMVAHIRVLQLPWESGSYQLCRWQSQLLLRREHSPSKPASRLKNSLMRKTSNFVEACYNRLALLRDAPVKA
jgi:hypothetical protein